MSRPGRPHRTMPVEGQTGNARRRPAKGILMRLLPRMHKRRKEIVVEDLSQKLIPVIGRLKFATVLHNVFSPEECSNLIALVEERGFGDALIQGPFGNEILRNDIRKCDRCIVDDEDIAGTWFVRLMEAVKGTCIEEKVRCAPWMQESVKQGQATPSLVVAGINERLRFLRYSPGCHFGQHQDNHYTRGPEEGDRAGETSHVTVMFYLNDHMKGGETRFGEGGRFLDVVPRTGSILIFDHDIIHQSRELKSGMKYCCRTDLMYASSS